ncbi:MAG: type III pantothenate kinase [Bacteroidia bacterium]
MRFRALHEFTARLPLVTFEEVPPLIGDSTIQSMRSGVINGVIAEINGVINLQSNLSRPTGRLSDRWRHETF